MKNLHSKTVYVLLLEGVFLFSSCKTANSADTEMNNKKKNLIIIKADELKYDLLGYMDHPVIKTPNIDKLAEKGNVFVNDYTVSPLCTPSRASFFTGKYTMEHGCKFVDMDNHMKPDQWSFVHTLKNAGYIIGLAGKNHVFNDEFADKYFDYWEEYTHFGKRRGTITEKDKEIWDYRHTDPRKNFDGATPDQGKGILGEGLIEGPMPFKVEETMTYRIAEDGITFLEKYKDETFMLHYSFPDPHWPNVVPDPYYSMYNPDDMVVEGMDINWDEHPFVKYVQSISQGYDKYTVAERQRILATMFGQITFIDKAVGMLMDKLEEMGLMDNTAIVFTSDHGNFAGLYGLIGKTKSYSDALIRVPLIIDLPGIEGGNTFNAQIENIDVMPTIMEYLGVNYTEPVSGKSFLSVIKKEKEDSHRNVIFSERGLPGMPPPIMEHDDFMAYRQKRIEESGTSWFLEYTSYGRSAMVKKDNWKYCYYTGDREELYNCAEDPKEFYNLASDPTYKSKLEEMRKLWKDQLLEKAMRNN